jgi:hypothetical protein
MKYAEYSSCPKICRVSAQDLRSAGGNGGLCSLKLKILGYVPKNGF